MRFLALAVFLVGCGVHAGEHAADAQPVDAAPHDCPAPVDAASAPTVIVGTWGDSMTWGAGSAIGGYPTWLSVLLHVPVFNEGISGQTSSSIAARVVANTATASYPTIIWAGRNDIATPATVESDIAAMVASLTTSHYFILAVTNTEGEGIGTTAYNEIKSINDSLAATYGEHFLDIRSMLVSMYDPSDPKDMADHAADIVPNSLRYYGQVHLVDAGYQAVAKYIYDRRSVLGFE